MASSWKIHKKLDHFAIVVSPTERIYVFELKAEPRAGGRQNKSEASERDDSELRRAGSWCIQVDRKDKWREK